MMLQRNIILAILLTQSLDLGIRFKNGVDASHLYSEPIRFFAEPRVLDNAASGQNNSLRIYVSEDDSSINIKKDDAKSIKYYTEWLEGPPHKLNITFGMKADGDFDLWKDELINIEELEKSTHSIELNCAQDNFTLTIEALDRGKTELAISNVTALDACHTTPTTTSLTVGESQDITDQTEKTKASTYVSIYASDSLNVASEVIGWVYFAAWSVSFYPQVWVNWRRKSVIGLNFDFLTLNVVGFSLYSLYNCGLYWIKPVQELYQDQHDTQLNPVKVNDVVFGLHAVFACIVTIIQCFIYERADQRVSNPCRILVVLFLLFNISTMIATLAGGLDWLAFLTYASYVKLLITLIKYMPQAYMNFRRKSTVGWSIGNVLLDFTGGSLSMGQMIMDAANFDDWSSFFGDITKFGLGLFSVVFDILFILQHYVCYRNRTEALDRSISDEPIVGTVYVHSGEEETDQNNDHGHTNMAYVAAEVAEVASATAQPNKRD